MIAAVCQPLAASPFEHSPCRRVLVEMEHLRVELAGELLDLVGIDRMLAADEALANMQIVEEERRHVHRGPVPTAA